MANTLSTHRGIAILGATGVSRMIDSSDVDDIILNSQYLNGRNLIINGAMQVAQRTMGQDATGKTSGGIHQCDRWYNQISSAGTFTIQKDSGDHPDGFGESIKYDCTTANASLGSTAELILYQKIEGRHLQHLGFGTSSVKDLTLSFHVKSNLTGTLTAELYNIDPATDRQCSKTYTIDAADTWEYKTITYTGDSAQPFDNDNTVGLYMLLWLGAGSTRTSGTLNSSGFADNVTANRVSSSNLNLESSTSNYIAFTGIQLEAGSKATPFEHKTFEGYEHDCQRYYHSVREGSGGYMQFTTGRAWSTSGANGPYKFPRPMAKTPTMTAGGAAGDYDFGITSVPASGSVTHNNDMMVINVSGSFSTGQIIVIGANGGGSGPAELIFDAEI